jgi:predicted ribosome quality control (RQC) complex YloA/Tae2 family protein
MISKTYTTTDQLDVEGKPIDKIFTITTTESIEYQKQETLSGTENIAKIKELEEQRKILQTKIDKLDEEINFYKTLK